MGRQRPYPFTAIVGQERMKLALILNIINPRLGGVLIRGEKGTAKSTAVRSLAQLMPEYPVVCGCRFGCDPREKETFCPECGKREHWETKLRKMTVVDLPVSATEDRVVGTLDMERALKTGEKSFEPGILAEANRNILYVDEINLLDDHVVDLLLDSAAMGVNFVEREGISFSHPSRFTLVGTMNPEEGQLRPQLLDRFGLVVDVTGEREPQERVEVIARRLEYEKSPQAFAVSCQEEEDLLAQSILKARESLPGVAYSRDILLLAAKVCIALGVDGHRADICMVNTARTIAAFQERKQVGVEDMKQAALFVLPHRMHRRPFDDGKVTAEEIIKLVEEAAG